MLAERVGVLPLPDQRAPMRPGRRPAPSELSNKRGQILGRVLRARPPVPGAAVVTTSEAVGMVPEATEAEAL